MDEELLNQLEEFNKNSQYKINLIVGQNGKHDEVGIKGGYPYIAPETTYEFTFEINTYNIKYIIKAYEFTKEAFELSKLICEMENAKLKVDFLIKNNCKIIIKSHNQQSEIWDNYLNNWESNSAQSEYKTLEEAMQAREAFSNSLQDKMVKHLKKYESWTLEEIESLNQHINNIKENINLLIQNTPLVINKSIDIKMKCLYSLEI